MEYLLMSESQLLIRLADKWLSIVAFLYYFFISLSFCTLSLKEIVVGVLFILEFTEKTTTFLQFNIASLLPCAINVFVDFSRTHVAYITRQQMFRQVSQTVKVANSKAVLNYFLLFVCELVKHRSEVRNLKVISQLRLILQIFIAI